MSIATPAATACSYLDEIKSRCKFAARFSTGDAAAIFGVSADTIRAWMEEGRLESINLNAGTHRRPHYQITRQAIIALAEKISKENP